MLTRCIVRSKRARSSGVAGQLRQLLQTGMQSISVVFYAHPTGMNINERGLIWIDNLKRKKICLMRTAYSEEEQDDDVQGTPYLTRNTPDTISPRMLHCSNVQGIAFSSHGSQVSSGLFVFGAGGSFLPAGFSQGAEMAFLEAFFTFWSAIIIALLTLLGIDVMQIWMLDRQSSKT